ncbi:MAG: hypothetical protein JW959_11755 [Pirellulales bacterium]|nr:hypothetical protein [Pirellulales bacterium]
MAADTEKCPPAKNVLALGVGVYAALWLCLLFAAFIMFGIDAGAVVLMSITAVPALVALRMLLRTAEVKKREWVFLAVLTLFVLGSGLYTIGYWVDIGLADNHASNSRFRELTACAKKDSAFSNIEFSRIEFKVGHDLFEIRGTVPSQADLERLKSLCDKYRFSFHAKDVVISGGSDRENE